MKTLDEIRRLIRQHHNTLAGQYGVAVVGVFGSYVRKEQRIDSDLDLLVEILRPIDLLDLVGAELHLSDVLGMKLIWCLNAVSARNCGSLSSRRQSPHEPQRLTLPWVTLNHIENGNQGFH